MRFWSQFFLFPCFPKPCKSFVFNSFLRQKGKQGNIGVRAWEKRTGLFLANRRCIRVVYFELCAYRRSLRKLFPVSLFPLVSGFKIHFRRLLKVCFQLGVVSGAWLKFMHILFHFVHDSGHELSKSVKVVRREPCDNRAVGAVGEVAGQTRQWMGEDSG